MDLLQIKNDFSSGFLNQGVSESKLKKLSDDIKRTEEKSSDEELMKACKSFESYMLEQVLIKMEKMAHIDEKKEKDNEYVSMFKENFMKDAAQMMTEHTDLGIAKMLFDSMKRNVLSKTEES